MLKILQVQQSSGLKLIHTDLQSLLYLQPSKTSFNICSDSMKNYKLSAAAAPSASLCPHSCTENQENDGRRDRKPGPKST